MASESPQRLSFDAAVAEWSREAAEDRVVKAIEERAEFVERFPADIWPDLPLEKYALGLPNSENGFSRWIEFRTPNAGSIKGGSSKKHLVFKRKSRPGWGFQKKYSSETEAWEAIRHGFAELVQLLSQGEWALVDQIEALWEAPAVRTKTAWMYFPDLLLPVYSSRHIDFFIQIFDVKTESDGAIRRNRALFEALTSMEAFAGWSPLEIMVFLYDWADPNPGHEILKVAPGEGASLWANCLANGYIRVGWDAVDDLTLLEDVDDIRQALIDHEGMSQSSALTKAARGLDDFRSLEDGDIVIANRGLSTVVGIGRVAGGYQYRPDLNSHRHTVSVDWFDTTERHVDFGAAWRSTIVRVKSEQYHEIVHDSGRAELIESAPLPPVPELHREIDRLLRRKKQTILYGPPGTGKTYSARRHAVWALAGGLENPEAARSFLAGSHFAEMEDELSTALPASKPSRPSWLLVANPQQWKWSSLVDERVVDYHYGRIKGNYELVEVGDTVYGYEATPTKAVVARAQVEHGLHTNSAGEKTIHIGHGVLLAGGPSWSVMESDSVLAESEPVRLGMQGTLFRLEPHEAARLEELMTPAPSNDVQARSERGGVSRLTRVTFHPSYTYEDFIEGYKPVESGRGGLELVMRDGIFKRLCRAAAKDPDNEYVLLIDEINRGNVPKILGELITLLEADKRGVTVTLPQSGDSLQVPPNLYIIGTMNTADRSIHVLDTALRRRFAFVELLPDPRLLEGASVGSLPLDELLEQLNSLVREQIGREKQIGHALLMNNGVPISSVDELALAFRYEVLPLLQEYTFGDYGELAELLGSEIIDDAAQVPRASVLDDPEQLIAALRGHLNVGLG